MASTRRNPYFTDRQFVNPGMAGVFQTIADAMLMQQRQQQSQSDVALDMARAGQADATAQANLSLAGYRDAQAAGQRLENQAFQTAPTSLAELFMTGGRFQDDPIRANPDFAPPPSPDYSLMPQVDDTPIVSALMPSRSGQDKFASALMEAAQRGMNPEQLMQAVGTFQYLQGAMGGNPSLGLAPFAGVNPNTQTSLTPARQDEISARDAAEERSQAESTAQIRGRFDLQQEGMRQAGQDRRQQTAMNNRPVVVGRNSYLVTPDGQVLFQGAGVNQQPGGRSSGSGSGGLSASSVPQVNVQTAQAIKQGLTERLNAMGLKAQPAAIDAMAAEAALRMQDPNSGAFKNPMAALNLVVDDLAAGGSPGNIVRSEQPAWFGLSSRETVTVEPGNAPRSAAPAQPRPAQPKMSKQQVDQSIKNARDAIARGAPRDAVIQRLRENGIDPSGL